MPVCRSVLPAVWKSGADTLPMNTIRQILVIKPSSLGDILHVFPALQLLKKHYPEAEMDFLVNTEFDQLLDFSPFPIRRRIHFERKKLASPVTGPAELVELIRSLRRQKYDLVIDFQGLLRSAFCAWISGHKKNRVYGFAAPREPISGIFYSRKAGVSKPHAVEKNIELVNFITGNSDSVPAPAIPVSEQGSGIVKKQPEHYVLLLPGARWESKCFPVALFAQTAEMLLEKTGKHLHFTISGSKAEIPLAAKLRSLLPEDFPVNDLTGKTTLQELFELIRNADAVVSNDSGPMHIAALLKTPVFSFFGPTDQDKTGPWAQQHRVFSAGAKCGKCMQRICPLEETVCHKLDPEVISSAIFEQLYQKDMSK